MSTPTVERSTTAGRAAGPPGRRGAGGRAGGTAGRWALGLALPVVLIAAWQVAKSAGALPYTDVPAPSTVWTAFATLVSSGELAGTVGHTVLACLGGWVLGSFTGLLLGLLLGLSHRAFTYGMASVDVLRAVPAIAFVPIAVIVLSQTLTMEIVIAGWVSVWPVAISTIDGVRGVTPAHREVARSLRMTPARRVLKFSLPTAMPKIVVALKLSLSAALVLAIVAEIVGNPEGIGNALVQEQQALRPDAMFAYILVTGVLGLVLNYALAWVLRLTVPGARTPEEGGHDA